eukprot:SAG31_NODE_15660_length_744_cov_0.936434_1_plen_174_part_01
MADADASAQPQMWGAACAAALSMVMIPLSINWCAKGASRLGGSKPGQGSHRTFSWFLIYGLMIIAGWCACLSTHKQDRGAEREAERLGGRGWRGGGGGAQVTNSPEQKGNKEKEEEGNRARNQKTSGSGQLHFAVRPIAGRLCYTLGVCQQIKHSSLIPTRSWGLASTTVKELS